ncbi:ABC transporter ATP-binding protein/permease [Candidatus Symbiopectobacterium sp. NZEC151]|uniref:ABC transporter ATP-binding protein/permease n=2 Tax=unclassified Symbiopectobacterium TaxID=2794573 RepID=UPI002226A59E|nr:ABC transporter ATP-binding protein/permease [Candidatus Symbiopectobacterium sp. NZEC151]MCW2475768.1 ABC transporter ATP-binding protein/permease [Candidatus Symbiopectobacterium sp. NZEC151]
MTTIRQFIYLVKPFWGSRGSLFCWFLLLLSLGLTLSSVWFNIQMNQWNGSFYNALQQLDGQHIYVLLRRFVVLVTGLILVIVLGAYFQQKLLIRWRERMTADITRRWLSDHSRHYQLKLAATEPDNPDQRIAEDIRLLVESTLKLLVSFLHATLTLMSFTAILWQLSGSLSFSLGASSWHIPGYMFWACILYTLLGMAVTQWIGSPLRHLNMERQRHEANYRAALLIRRQHSDAIAGQRGEGGERHTLMQHFIHVMGNWNQLIRYERNLSFFTVGYQQVTALAPILFALPKFLAGEIMLGGLMQLRQAFASVATSLSWFVFAYKEIAAWQATVARLYHFVVLLDGEETPSAQATEGAARLRAQLTVMTPDKTPLLTGVTLNVQAGELLLLTGPSGLGKSTLLRTLSGHWPYYTGSVQHDTHTSWIPQGSYLPPGRLDTLLAYPRSNQVFSVEQYRSALSVVGLMPLSDRLEQDIDWAQQLSGGEQQRVLFARLLLNQPKLLLLDETTSALDETSARTLLRQLKQHLPDSAIVLVSHQTFLREEAERVIDLTGYAPVAEQLPLAEGTLHAS